MSLLSRINPITPGRARERGGSMLNLGASNASGKGLAARGKALAGLDDAQNALLSKAVGAINSDSVLGRAVGNLAEQLGVTRPRKDPVLPSAGQRAQWTAAPVWGGLSPEDFYRLFRDSAMTAKAWKNLFHVAVTETRPSAQAPGGVPGSFNLLALDVSFAPVTLPGDAVPIGSANMDHLAGAERVELRITTLDDDRGSIKRWFLAKAAMATHGDGTFGLPVDYLVQITVTHMDPSGLAHDDLRLRESFIMRPSNLDVELSRRDAGHEELQMSFVQFDTFQERF